VKDQALKILVLKRLNDANRNGRSRSRSNLGHLKKLISLMDLSVLKGDDPAGYKAEQLLKESQIKNQNLEQRDRSRNPGSIAGADSGQFHVYWRDRRKELDRVELLEEERKAQEEEHAFQEERKRKQKELEGKAVKRRKKRLAKKQKQSQKKTV